MPIAGGGHGAVARVAGAHMKILCWGVLGFIAVGCGAGDSRPSGASPIARIEQPLAAGAVAATKYQGESCAGVGRAACRDGMVCLKIRPEPGPGNANAPANSPASHICVKTCTAPADCEAGFGCREIMPYKRACTPLTRDFVAHRVGVTR